MQEGSRGAYIFKKRCIGRARGQRLAGRVKHRRDAPISVGVKRYEGRTVFIDGPPNYTVVAGGPSRRPKAGLFGEKVG